MEEVFSDSMKPKDERITNLTDLVFSWSLQDILNEELYADQVQRIPTVFNSAEQYLDSYNIPLLEETRQELASSMEIMHSAPYAEVTYLDECKPYGTLIYNVKVDAWKNKFSDRGKDPYRTLPGDILVLSDAKPESFSDLQQLGTMWAFGSVINITDEENEDISTSTHFKIKVSKDIEFKDGGESLFVVFLTNITTNKRIWKALHMLRNLNIINKVLCINEEVEESCQVCCEHSSSQLANPLPTGVVDLNNSQTEAVLNALFKMKCDHKPSVELVWGPPGTGKTKTVSVLLFNLLKSNLRTLVCAPTNIAITEVASRLLKLLTESSKAEYHEDYAYHSYGDLLLYGNKARLKVSSDMENIYLDYRADRLAECLGSLTGWKHCLNSMISLLEDCVDQYKVFVENESIKAEQNHEDESDELKYKSFLEFLRARFECTVPPLRQCLLIFCTHLPVSFVGEKTYRDMVTLTHSLNSLEKLLLHDSLVSESLEKLFLGKELVLDSPRSCGDLSLLLCLRNSSISIGKGLCRSLDRLKLPSALNRPSIMKFCFQRASAIFCTVSTSYKLHLVDMEPLKVLVVDEAAQLKECESVIPLQLKGMQHAILIGDECQLPATVQSTISDDAGFGRSLFKRLSLLGHSKHLLNIQYRMHPSISCFPNSKFYRNQILNARNVKDKSYMKNYLSGPMFGPYSFINIVGGKEEMDDVGHSRRNLVEVAVVRKIVQDLYKAWTGSRMKVSVGIVSPYAAQVVAIQDKIEGKYENLDGFSVKVKSVDGFQGGEEDIIIISTVRSNNTGSIGFISSPQRTNVALTRARHSLWILGNERTLTNGESIWKALIHDAKNRKCFFNADENRNLAKSIVDAKKELDQLEDLLNTASVLFRTARWKVIFSNNFRKSFGKLSLRMKKSVLNLLLKLSNGWRPKNRNVDSVCESSPQILKKFKVEGLYVVCTIDVVKEANYKQVLKVWDVLSVEEIPKLVKRLDSIFCMHTDEFISHCSVKLLDGNLEIPKCWHPSHEIIRYKISSDHGVLSNSRDDAIQGRSYAENSRVNDSLLLMKFYPLSSSVVVNHLLSDDEGKNFDLPFEVTDEEMEIILYDKSCFILGRSGTGKTTVLTMKLYQREHRYNIIASEEYCKDESSNATESNQKVEPTECKEENKELILRQLFVTVNPKLCYAVKQHVSQLKSFARGGKFSEDNLIDKDGMDDAAEFKDIPDSFRDIPADSYPLVLTYQKFLMMLDGTLENSYFERFHDARQSRHERRMGLSSVSFQTFVRMKEVNYDKFCSCYWPHFSNNLTKKLDASRVFIEIISYIKGGIQAVEACDLKLDRDEYLQIAESRVSTLSRQNREKIYDIYKDYEKMKLKRGEYDLADLVIDLHRRLRYGRFEGQKMDFVYIDEVQDLTMSQISLFKYVCGNVDEGFVFSGDTAQTIARGIDFRFQDIRSLFYKVFMKSGSDRSVETKEKGRLSEIFSLSQNFRTHDAVLRLAQSVIALIYRFFPNFIDVLKPETSLISGEAPVFLEPGNEGNAIETIFGNTGSVDRKIVGFGAEQVILVRDDSVREEISSSVGKQALILTILECKGLEFQDVLLYNFFGSSPLKNQWRVVYEYMKEQDLLDDTCLSFPSFDMARHNLLSSELKQLYVAITRTRQRLWISESVEDLSKPMFDYWKRRGLVQVQKLNDSLAQAMQVASSAEEWKSRGKKLFFEHYYEKATMCFERAGDATWEKRAKASGLKAAAEPIRKSNPKVACTYIREAAEIFDSIGRVESAAVCYCELGEFERAGRIYLDKCGESERKKAAECFNLAGNFAMAAEVYAKGSYISECLSVCRKAKLFDVGLQYIEYWKQNNFKDNGIGRSKEFENIEEFLEGCALSFHELKDSKSMMKFVRAFYSMDLTRSFLKSVDRLDELLLLEEESGYFFEAAEIARMNGDLLHEADLRGKSGHFCEASLIILWYVCCNSLWMNRSKGWPLKQFTKKEELFSKAKEFAKKDSESLYELVCSEINILSHENSRLADLGTYLKDSQRHISIRGEILSLRKILDAYCSMNATEYEWQDELPVCNSSHSEEMISQNKASVTSLVYFWSLWKENIGKLFEYLGCLESQESSKFLRHGEFCLNFFGARRQLRNSNTTFLVLVPDADWLREVDERTLQKNRNLIYVDCQQFVFAAQCYWKSEILSVGMELLRTLEALFDSTTKHGSSMFMQSVCLINMFEVARCLLNCKFLSCKYHESKALLYYVDLSTRYIQNVFPLDWRRPVCENFVRLRGTDLSQKLLEEAVRDISNKGELTYGKIGKVVMMWLGTAKPTELCWEIMIRFKDNVSWSTFLKNLNRGVVGNSQEIVELDSPSEVALKEFTLVYSFYKALEDTYGANWRVSNYISPNCFLYLMDRLLIMVSRFEQFFVTTRSSFVEWILCQNTNAYPCTALLAGSQSPSLVEIYDFLASMVDRLLNNKFETGEWIKRSNLNYSFYYPLLVLKLFVILCLLCLYSQNYYGLLFSLLGKSDVTCMLPKDLLDVLSQSKKRNYIDLSLNLLSEAFTKIGDPLVTVSFGKRYPSKYRVAICVDMEAVHCREDIIRMLFPRNAQEPEKGVPRNAQEPEKGAPNTSGMERHLSGGDAIGMSSTNQSSNVPSADLNWNGLSLKKNWDVFVNMFDPLKKSGSRKV
ncbi:UvrD-like helicase ATP-binding domain-containing protein [Heracleum sosnowskyi]|uniref:UvrD-like helicase ATP-binding domain-containing protein n=1 Tax=Heracleum sosnowskyi TaxID=360622 RepID=A0AAD8IA02_9APIA|nr:UvrD-like helicase ATP-binding domain-containing protein [Heracleum sosnowskyi]